jgi:drug/metabolite transporter (DMT)-like permease
MLTASARHAGLSACVVSAVSFGTLPILAKVALDDGASTFGLLWVRFTIAAAVFWALEARQPVARPPVRAQVSGLLMGCCGYALEAALFFAALQRIDASLTELLLYAYPGLVTVVALGRRTERATPPLMGALLLASAGLVLVFGSSLAAGADPVGLTLAVGAAVVYSGYVLCGERVVATVEPLRLAALVSTGAAIAFTAAGTAGADLSLPHSPAGLAAVVLVATAATVVPMVTLFAGIRRVGAPTASIISTLEPVVTVLLAVTLLGERLGPGELAGAAAVIGAVGLLAAAGPPRSPQPSGPAPVPAAGRGWPWRWAFRPARARSWAPAPAPTARPAAAATPGPRRPG